MEEKQKIVEVREGVYDFLSSDGETYYRVIPEEPSCECKGFEYRGGCRHLKELAVLSRRNQYDLSNIPPLFTTRYANKALKDAEVLPVATSRGRPKFSLGYPLEDELPEIAPPYHTFQLEGEAFVRKYWDWLNSQGVDLIATRLRAIVRRNGSKPIALLCYEDVLAGELCHRRVFARWWKKATGVDVPELTLSEMLAQYGREGVTVPGEQDALL